MFDQILEMVKQVEDKYNPKAPKDSANKLPDSLLQQLKLNPDSPKKDSPPKVNP